MSKIKIIVGPPCSGKSTYVAKIKDDDDVAIDYDKIAQALGSNESHAASQSISFVASKARFAAIDAVLAGVAATAWIIHTSPSQEMIEQYEAAAAEFYLMDTDLETCLQRAAARPDGTSVVIEDWFENRPVLPNAILINSNENKMTKAYSTLKVKAINEDGDTRTITGIASTPKQDRDGDIMDMEGAQFALPMPLLWQHKHNEPIGEVTSATVTADGIEITATIVKIEDDGPLKERIDTAWQSIKSGLVKGLSIGFRLLEYNYLDDSYGLHIKEWEWYELSAVTIPANPDGKINTVKNIKQAFLDAQKRTPQPPKHEPDATPAEPIKTAPPTPSEPIAKKSKTITLVDPNRGSIPLITGENL